MALAAAAITAGLSLPVRRRLTRNADTIAGVQAPAKMASNTRRTVYGESPLEPVISAKTSLNLGISSVTEKKANSRSCVDHDRSRSIRDETARPRQPILDAEGP